MHIPSFTYHLNRLLFGNLFGILLLFCFLLFPTDARSQNLNEGFENVDDLFSSGWVRINNSEPTGYGKWQQDNGNFVAQSGSPNSSIVCDYNSVNGNGNISNWLITPELLFSDGDTLFFWTKSYANIYYPDRLEIRISTAGSSTDVGTDQYSTGVFGTVLFSINPNLDTTVGAYPMTWTRYAIPIPASANGFNGRIAFRYFITNGGVSGINGSTIGVDNLIYQSVLTGIKDETSLLWKIYPNPTTRLIYVDATSDAEYAIYSLSGKAITQGKFHAGLNMLDLSGLSQSVYLMYISLDNGKKSVRHIIIK